MPSIIFHDLLGNLVNDQQVKQELGLLIQKKSEESEKSNLSVPTIVYENIVSVYQSLSENTSFDKNIKTIKNDDFRDLLNR